MLLIGGRLTVAHLNLLKYRTAVVSCPPGSIFVGAMWRSNDLAHFIVHNFRIFATVRIESCALSRRGTGGLEVVANYCIVHVGAPLHIVLFGMRYSIHRYVCTVNVIKIIEH